MMDQNSTINVCYLKVANIVEDFLKFKQTKFNSEEMNRLRERIIHCESDINYDQLAGEFAQLYWLRNFWKAVYFFKYEYSIKQSILDKLYQPDYFLQLIVLGAGSAADTIACMVWLNEKLPLARVKISLIDQSQDQLDLARKLICLILPVLDRVKFDITYQRVKAKEWSPIQNCADIILMSHFLNENPADLSLLLEKVRFALGQRGDAVIIERERDPIWKKTLGLLGNLGTTLYDTDLSRDKFVDFYLASEKKVDNDITPYYIKASIPEKKFQADIVRKYFQAWRLQSLDLINEIFSKDAIYDEKPGIEPRIKGIEEILSYWNQNPMLQKNIDVQVRNVAYGENTIVCAFEGKFDTPKKHIAIRGAMNFYIDDYSQRIRKFDEYFGTDKFPLK